MAKKPKKLPQFKDITGLFLDKKKKKSRKSMLTTLDEQCKQLVRLINSSRCQMCGKYVEGSDAHTSHIVPKGNGCSWRRFDLLNLQLMCHHCHMERFHHSPTDGGVWVKEKYPYVYDYLDKYRGGKPTPIKDSEMEGLIGDYKQKLNQLRKEMK